MKKQLTFLLLLFSTHQHICADVSKLSQEISASTPAASPHAQSIDAILKSDLKAETKELCIKSILNNQALEQKPKKEELHWGWIVAVPVACIASCAATLVGITILLSKRTS